MAKEDNPPHLFSGIRHDHLNYIAIVLGWLLLIFALNCAKPPPLSSGLLANNDDYSRMVRVFDILDGTSEASYLQQRIGVDGAEVNWSRLIDWPLAAIQFTFETFMERHDAAVWTATLWPALLLLCLFFAAYWALRPFTSMHAVLIVLPVCISLCAILRQFIPGRIDHHMVQILLMIFAYGGLARLYFQPTKIIYAVLPALCFATGLAIGTDIIPALVIACVFSGLLWLQLGQEFEKPLMIFGVSLLGFTTLLHLTIPPYDRLLVPSCESLSPVFISMTAAVGAFFSAIYFAPDKFKSVLLHRLNLSAAIFALLAGGLYFGISGCVHDPYQLENPEIVREIWLKHVHEAKPIYVYAQKEMTIAIVFALPIILGFIGAIAGIFVDPKNRALWIAFTAALTLALILTLYQLRTTDMGQVIALIPYSMGILWLWAHITKLRGQITELYFNVPYGLRIGGLIIAILALTVLTIKIGIENRQDAVNELANNSVHAADNADKCNIVYGALAIDRIRTQMTVAAFVDDGPKIMYWTNHRVLAAPYHRNGAGIIAAHEILTAPNHLIAKEKMEAYKTDVVMICKNEPNIWIKSLIASDAPSFAKNLYEGFVPYWLEPVKAKKTGGYLIFKKVSEE